MKVRHGFVSNSSSSSFVCCNCGETFEAMDDSFGQDEIMCPECEKSPWKYPDDFTAFLMDEVGLVPSVWLHKYWRMKGEGKR